MGGFYTAPAVITEYMHCFLATDLSEVSSMHSAEESIEVERRPLADLPRLLDGEVQDAKSLIGLLRLARMRGL